MNYSLIKNLADISRKKLNLSNNKEELQIQNIALHSFIQIQQLQ
jgi:hypothetical protein